jgi:hypothetical protein
MPAHEQRARMPSLIGRDREKVRLSEQLDEIRCWP